MPCGTVCFLRECCVVAEDILPQWLEAMRGGDFERAWELSDRALIDRRGQTFSHLPRHEQPVWDGTPLEGRRVLVRCYHGLGDTILFARYLPMLARIARQVIVWAQPPLLPLLSTIEGIRLLPLHDGTPECEYDVDIEIMELAHAFRCVASRVPYLDAPAAPLPRGVVGLAWRAGDWDPSRSIEFQLLSPLFALENVRFCALSVDAPHHSRLILDDRRLTIEGTASLMRGLELVISVDTMTAHLAGALGVPAWTLLPKHADWRWMEDRSDSPWYPTMRLFRQAKPGDWREVIDRVLHALRTVRSA